MNLAICVVSFALIAGCSAQDGSSENNPLDFGQKPGKGRQGDQRPIFLTSKSPPHGCQPTECGFPGESNHWDTMAAARFDPQSISQGRKKRQVTQNVYPVCETESKRIWWVKFYWPFAGSSRPVWAYVWSHIPWVECKPNANHVCNRVVYYDNYKYCCKQDYAVMSIIVLINTPVFPYHPLRPRIPLCFNNWSGRQMCFVRLWVKFPNCCNCVRCKMCTV